MRWLWLSLLALGCGARSTLEVGGDASAPPPPPPIDAGTDAGTAPPPPPPMGCALGPRRGPYVDGAPAFVFSLGPFADPLADSEGEYVLGYAQGWPPDERGAIGLLDLDLNELDVVHAAGTEQVAAVQADTELMRFTDDDRVLDVAWLDLTEDGWPERVRTNVCRECDASFAAMTPVLDGDRAALTYESGDDVVVWVVPVGGGASPLTTAFPEEGAPHLARHRGGYVLATQTADRRTTRVRFLDRDLGERVLLEVPLAPTGVPAGMVVRDDDVLLVGRAPEGEGERLVRVTEGGVDDVVPLPLPPDLRVGHAVAWAHGVVAIVAIGIDAVIALALEGAGFEPVLEPTPILERAGSHTRTARLAEHPDGFALVYGGWEPESHNGIYGRLLRCDGFD